MVRRLIFTLLVGLMGCFAASAQIDFPITDSTAAIVDTDLLWLYNPTADTLTGQTANDFRTYAGAGAGQLLPAGGTARQVLQRTAAASEWGAKIYVPDTSGDLPTPVLADIDNAIGLKEDGIYHATERFIHGVEPTGTWGAVTTNQRPDFHGAFGDHAQGRALALAVDDYILDTADRHFYEVYTTGGSSTHLFRRRNDPAEWLGFGNRQLLLARANAVGDWGFNTDDHTVEFLMTFTAGVIDQRLAEWSYGTPVGGNPQADSVVGLLDWLYGTLVISEPGGGLPMLRPSASIGINHGTDPADGIEMRFIPRWIENHLSVNYLKAAGPLTLVEDEANPDPAHPFQLTITNTNPDIPDSPTGHTNPQLLQTNPADDSIHWSGVPIQPLSTNTGLYNFLKANLQQGTNVTIVPNDTARTLTFSSSGGGGGGGLNDAQVVTIIERELPTVSSALAPGQTTDRYAWTPQLVRQAATAAADARTSDAVIDTVTPGNNGAVLSASRRAVANAVRAGSIHQINERISDATIDVSTPANESTTIAPSRQAVAEAIDGITVGGTADGVADSVDLAISGQDLSITVGRSVGVDLTDTVTLPVGGGGGIATPSPLENIGTVLMVNAAQAYTSTLTDTIESGYNIVFRLNLAGTAAVTVEVDAETLLLLDTTSGTPANTSASFTMHVPRPNNTGLNFSGHGALYIWKREVNASGDIIGLWGGSC